MLAAIAAGFFLSFFFSQAFPFDLSEGAPIAGLSLPGMGPAPREEPVLTSNAVPSTVSRDQLDQEIAAALAGPDDAERVLPFQIYTIRPGDSASAIADRFGITLQYLLWNNQELSNQNLLRAGHQLFIPAANGIVHLVGSGETLDGIARYYGVTPATILAWEGNGIETADQIVDAQLLFVPGGVLPALRLVESQPPPSPNLAPAPPLDPSIPVDVAWPFIGVGRLTTPFGGGHSGIDLDGIGYHGAAIAAATSGTVIRAVTSTINGYGLFVDVVSPNGILTRYAHLSSISVQPGQPVSQGDTVGIIGATGNARGTHLHFEVHVNGRPVNPLIYLP
ncbi:MAG: M23 family metallopeptidase [Chloroflexi bacterium]|nr:M23 family metallopeptidase [Chloroflexota bacterium]